MIFLVLDGIDAKAIKEELRCLFPESTRRRDRDCRNKGKTIFHDNFWSDFL